MLKESYNYQGDTLVDIDEPVADCGRVASKKSASKAWNPNVPFVGTQEQWWEHFHEIEKGKFMTIEEADIKFEIWRRNLLATKSRKYRNIL